MKNKKLLITFMASTMAFVLNTVINFFLTPYIVGKIGSEAYGFISLANNFTNYIQLLTIALNSMAGRFITIEIERGNIKGANQYFNSVLVSNLLVVAITFIPVTILILKLNNIVNITPGLVYDVKLLFAFIFAAFFVNLIGATFSTSTFVANRLDINSYISAGSYLVRLIAMIVLFALISPRVWIVGNANLLAAIFIFVLNFIFTKKLLPQINLRTKYFNIKKLLTIIKSGIWNTITKVGMLIADGLDLLITNLYIDAAMMGTLSIAKSIPGVITSFVGTLSSLFVPSLTINYAHDNKDEILSNINKSINISSAIANIAYTALIVCGFQFFMLWVPSQDARLLQILSILTVASNIMIGGVNCLLNMYTVLNEVKKYSIVFVSTSLLSIVIVFVLLKTTSLGVFAIAGVSTVVSILKTIIFVIPYISVKMGYKWCKFFPIIMKNLAVVLSCIFVQLYIKSFFDIDTWIKLIMVGVGSVILSAIVNTLFILGKNGRKLVIDTIMSKIKKN